MFCSWNTKKKSRNQPYNPSETLVCRVNKNRMFLSVLVIFLKKSISLQDNLSYYAFSILRKCIKCIVDPDIAQFKWEDLGEKTRLAVMVSEQCSWEISGKFIILRIFPCSALPLSIQPTFFFLKQHGAIPLILSSFSEALFCFNKNKTTSTSFHL